jgi:hypothetical protein
MITHDFWTTVVKVIELLSIKNKPRKGHGKSIDKWDWQLTEFETHVRMPVKGISIIYWKQQQLSSGQAGLSKIEQENESNEGGTMWCGRKVRLENCIAQMKSLNTTTGRSSSQSW